MTKTVTAIELLREAALELNHSKVFVRSREKMHPDGIRLYDDLLDKIYQFLKAQPDEPTADPVVDEANFQLRRLNNIVEKLDETAQSVGIPKFICLAKQGECQAVLDQENGQFVRLIDLRRPERTIDG